MNKQDRKNLSAIIETLETAHSSLEEMAEAEREKYDNMPEGLQESERGQAIDEAATSLEEQASTLEDILSSLRELSGDE